MGRCSLVLVALLGAVVASGCGGRDPSPPQPLTPEEERQYQEELQRRREQEGRSSPAKEGD